MIKNNKIKTCIVGACIIANTVSMTAFADTDTGKYTTPANDPNKAVTVQMAPDSVVNDGRMYKTQEAQVSGNDAAIQKQSEIDKYLFQEHADEISQKGFVVTHTGPVGSKVEIGINPYTEANAEYLYKIFGEDAITVVAEAQPEIMQAGVASPEKAADTGSSRIAAFFSSIVEWFRNIF